MAARVLLSGALLLAAGLDPGSWPRGDESPSTAYSEYQVKAAYLFNFTKYVEWPPEVFPDPSASFVLGVLGHDPFQGAVEEVIRGRQANGRSLGWKAFHDPPVTGACHVLFIGEDELRRRDNLLPLLQGKPILTVGESEAFGRAGGIIWFTLEDRTVHIVINPDAARRARLTISSKLLRIARVTSDQELGAGR